MFLKKNSIEEFMKDNLGKHRMKMLLFEKKILIYRVILKLKTIFLAEISCTYFIGLTKAKSKIQMQLRRYREAIIQ